MEDEISVELFQMQNSGASEGSTLIALDVKTELKRSGFLCCEPPDYAKRSLGACYGILSRLGIANATGPRTVSCVVLQSDWQVAYPP